MTDDPYVQAAKALQGIARSLVEARAVRYQAPPRVASGDPKPSNRAEVSNPTLDVVLDERRSALSSQVSITDDLLLGIAETLEVRRGMLDAALARWNNEES